MLRAKTRGGGGGAEHVSRLLRPGVRTVSLSHKSSAWLVPSHRTTAVGDVWTRPCSNYIGLRRRHETILGSRSEASHRTWPRHGWGSGDLRLCPTGTASASARPCPHPNLPPGTRGHVRAHLETATSLPSPSPPSRLSLSPPSLPPALPSSRLAGSKKTGHVVAVQYHQEAYATVLHSKRRLMKAGRRFGAKSTEIVACSGANGGWINGHRRPNPNRQTGKPSNDLLYTSALHRTSCPSPRPSPSAEPSARPQQSP